MVHGEEAEIFKKADVDPVVRKVLERDRFLGAVVRLAVEIYGIQHAAAGVRGAERVKRVGGEIVFAHIKLRKLRAAIERGQIGDTGAAQIERRCAHRDELLPEPDIPARENESRRRGEHDERRGADDQHACGGFRFVFFLFLHRESSGNQ